MYIINTSVYKAIEKIIDYPKNLPIKSTKNGYPTEKKYNRESYEKIVDTYREALREILKKIDMEAETNYTKFIQGIKNDSN